MKDQLSSVDVHAIVHELSDTIVDSRVDKVFQTGKNELVIRLFGKGRIDLVIANNFLCITNYKRQAPQNPSSFSMQLRKHLKAKEIKWVAQHEFERIVEFGFEDKILVFELFSKGNALLMDSEKKILGLVNWQKWRDRVLGVGQTYECPPERLNPMKATLEQVTEELSVEGKTVASVLATRFSLFGKWAKKACALAEIPEDAMVADVDAETVLKGIMALADIFKKGPTPSIDEEGPDPYSQEGRSLTFNELVDEHFSTMQIDQAEEGVEKEVDEKRQKLLTRLASHKELLATSLSDIESERAKGDLLYQHMGQVQGLMAQVKAMRDKSIADDKIVEALADQGIVGLEGCMVTVELN